MSESIRQSNLFAAEDYKKVFKAFSFIDYTAYDFDTLKQALINYIQTYYPEDFNDYIESSEFIAIIELLAYFGTSLAFRTDLNSRENFIDTAERRESIIRLAQMVNYVPRRNIAASGLFKIDALQTDELIVDANGVNINDLTIFWNDPNNPDWFDQFVLICNAAFSSLNPFGRPSKSGIIGGIPTDLYELDNITRQNVAYPAAVTINGQLFPLDICNPDFVTNETIFERDPDPANPFNFIYRNDSLGVGSVNTGFFLYFKQGNLINIDTNFEFPVPNRVFPINVQNINQDDVYVQQTDELGNVIAKWLKVPAISGENIIYNSIHFAERNIFSVLTGAFDTVSIRFADGNFGNVPTGLFRTWLRVSANQALVIRPDNAQGLQLAIPYIGADQQQYTLRIIFSLQQTIGNAAPTETSEQIKLRAPEVFSTQSRMVNGSDYNVLPLIYGNQIAKIQAIDRTYSGQSRYIDLNDPTGFHRDLIIFGEDGALYRDNQNVLVEVVEDASNENSIDAILMNTIQEMLRDPQLFKFYMDEYLPQFENVVRVNPPNAGTTPGGRSLLDLVPTPGDPSTPLFWATSPSKYQNDTGYFVGADKVTNVPLINTANATNVPGGRYQFFKFITSGSTLILGDPIDPTITSSSPVKSVIQNGVPANSNPSNPFANIGPVELGSEEVNLFQATKVYPAFRTQLSPTEQTQILAVINTGTSFWLFFDLLAINNEGQQGLWEAVSSNTTIDPIQQEFIYPTPPVPTLDSLPKWRTSPNGGLLYVNVTPNGPFNTYEITIRGRVYVFESYRDVRFYWEPNQVIVDNASGQAFKDEIEILPYVNTNSSVDNNEPDITDPSTSFLKTGVEFNITGVFVQDDGYLDQSKVEVSLVDNDSDGVPDDPNGFDDIVAPTDRVVFEAYINPVTGTQGFRPWIAPWNTALSSAIGPLYVYFPVNQQNPSELFRPPFIANVRFDPANPVDLQYIMAPNLYPNTVGYGYADLSDSDLIFINNFLQIEYSALDPLAITIPNQVSAFINGPTLLQKAAFPWMSGVNDPNDVLNKTDIINTYLLSKSFLIADTAPGYGKFYALADARTENPEYPTRSLVIVVEDKSHYDRNGKSFTQNESIDDNKKTPLYFKWSHFSPIDQRVDPAPTNIIDMIVITDSYYRDVIIWKDSNGTITTYPPAPTTEELRVQFQDLNEFKMLSDAMIWNSGTFKLLFGAQAEPELQATFKVVKAQSATISDNEVKTRVIQAIDTYFDIRNWDFGEKFFYTELAAFVHQQLSKIISSIVIVPNNQDSEFGNLFEIVAGPTEIFLSTATINNVQIVANLTDQNLRV
jgi:hypothetical protein